MRLLLRVLLLVCYALLSSETRGSETFLKSGENKDDNTEVGRNYTPANDRIPKPATLRTKVKIAGSKRVLKGPRNDTECTRLGGICQAKHLVCRGHYLREKCSGPKTRQCCSQAGAWSALCAGHPKNRVRACDTHGCGAFNSKRGKGLHKAVDLVCDDYGVIKAPFSGSLAGPVSRKDADGNHYDGIKLLSDAYCVKIFNIRPYRYVGPVTWGEALGYLLPLQDHFSGITSHVELHMCDGTDPSPFI